MDLDATSVKRPSKKENKNCEIASFHFTENKIKWLDSDLKLTAIDRFHVTSLPPWRTKKKPSLSSIVFHPTWPPCLCHLILRGLIINNLHNSKIMTRRLDASLLQFSVLEVNPLC